MQFYLEGLPSTGIIKIVDEESESLKGNDSFQKVCIFRLSFLIRDAEFRTESLP